MDETTYQNIRAYCLHDLAEYVDPKRDYGAMQVMRKLHGDTGEIEWDFQNAMRLFTSRKLTPRQKAAAHLLAVVSNHRAQAWRRETLAPDGADPLPILGNDQFDALETQTKTALETYAKRLTTAEADDVRAMAEKFAVRRTSATEDSAREQVPTHWKMKIQAEAADMFLRLYAQNCNPTISSIKNDLATWCRANNVTTDGKTTFPSADYIRVHVLSGKHWKKPLRPV